MASSSSAARKPTKRPRSETPQQPPFPQDTMGIKFQSDEEKVYFSHLHKRSHLVTKFAHVDTLEQFRLLDGISTLMRNGGLEEFLTKSAQSYPRMTTEFLCTLKRHETTPPTISFRLFNKPYTMNYQAIADAFGWRFPKGEWQQPEDGVLARFWSESTNLPYKREANKVWMLSHPAIHFVYRLLSMTLFLKGEPSGVALGELGCVWSLLNPTNGHPNWVKFFVDKCLYIQNSKVGKLSFGGMVTLLALKANVRIPSSCKPIQSRTTNFYDVEGLRMTKFITVVSGYPYYLINGDERGSYLPPHESHLFNIAPTDTPRQLYLRGQALHHELNPEDELPLGGEEEALYEDEEDADYVEEEEVPISQQSWQQNISERVGRLETAVQDLRHDHRTFDERFHTFEERSFGDMYDLQTQLQAMRMGQQAHWTHLAGAPFVNPLPEIQAFDAQRQAERQAHLDARRRRRGPTPPIPPTDP